MTSFLERLLARGVHLTGGTGLRNTRLTPIAVDVGVIAVVWIMLAVLAQPLAEFPLDDDWSYSRTVEILLHQGRLDLVFAAMPLVSQVAWGSLFCLPFGFSFTALHVSAWVLGLVGLVATYGLLRTLEVARPLGLFATFLLAANPIYFVLSFTFMTDVPFLALSVASITALANGIRRDRRSHVFLGLVLAFLALLIRQPALAILIGFGITYLIVRPLTIRNAMVAWTPAAMGYAILTGYEFIVRRTIGLPRLYNRPYDPITELTPLDVPNVIGALAGRITIELLYVGLFLLPLSLVVASVHSKAVPVRAKLVIAASGLAAVAVGIGLGLDRLLPIGNVLNDVGLGPPLLRDVYVLGLPHLPRPPRLVWQIVWGCAVAGCTLLSMHSSGLLQSVRGADLKRPSPTYAPLVLSMATGAAYIVFATVAGYLDRYLIWLVPLAMVVVLAVVPLGSSIRFGWPLLLGGALVVAYAAFSVAATHDYFAWNRSRWLALDHLTQDLQVPVTKIDGGFEFNGWYGYDPTYRERAGLSWWWVKDDEYVVAFGQLDGYAEVSSLSYQRWLPPSEGQIFILRRTYRDPQRAAGDGSDLAASRGA